MNAPGNKILSNVVLVAFFANAGFVAGCQQEKTEDKVKMETPLKIQEKKTQ